MLPHLQGEHTTTLNGITTQKIDPNVHRCENHKTHFPALVSFSLVFILRSPNSLFVMKSSCSRPETQVKF
jgi:hypothetical protein